MTEDRRPLLRDHVEPVPDAEVVTVLAAAIRDCRAGTMTRDAEMFRAGVYAEFLVEWIALARLVVVRCLSIRQKPTISN